MKLGVALLACLFGTLVLSAAACNDAADGDGSGGSGASTSSTDDDDGMNLPSCGDGVVDSGEACDDGATNSNEIPDACRANCQLAACGDGVIDTDEACDDATPECMTCTLTCPSDGAYCGGNGVGGDPTILYRCVDGLLHVEERCASACQAMPLGVPDRCPTGSIGEVPASLIDLLDPKPYVEGDCNPVTYPGWPYEALECSYTSGNLSAMVITATPSADRVGRWIIESTSYLPALAELETTDHAAWEEGLGVIGLAVLYQSSRIFPLEGGIIENMGNGYVNYPFSRGVTEGCGSGCYCRINSLHRTEWCTFVASNGGSYDACIAEVGASGFTTGWATQCLQNHIDAWLSDSNEHFRARAYRYNQNMGACDVAGACTPNEVLDALRDAAQ